MMTTPNNKTVYLETLGCAKNQVDSDGMAKILSLHGYQSVARARQADVIIVNTCGFIQAARSESIETLQKLGKRKKSNQLLIAAGCMTERYRKTLLDEAPNIDGFLATSQWMEIFSLINRIKMDGASTQSNLERIDPAQIPAFSAQGGSAYLKIADGCRRSCGFCAIPLIKGKLISRHPDNLVRDAQLLDEMGIQEMILIAQDVTDYGNDLGMKNGLVDLLKRLHQATSIPWIRLLYTFPGYITDEFIDFMADSPRVLPYLDMPLQHADPRVLKSMQRPADMQWVYQTIEKMRKKIPQLAIRTTFIVGYPTETEAAYQTLLDFIKAIEFDRIGVFAYSHEAGTPAEPLGDPISEAEKEARLTHLMETQSNISLKINQGFIGKSLDVLVEGVDQAQKIAIGRSKRDAPEIDGMVIVEGLPEVGKIAPVNIHAAMAYDLVGRLKS